EAIGVNWKIRRAGDPPKVTRVCTTSCVIRFGGAAKGRLQQGVSFDRKMLRFKVGDVISADGFINNTGVAGANVRMMIKIAYSDGHPVTKAAATRSIVQTGTSTSRSFGGLLAEITSPAVRKIKFIVISQTVSDTFSVESVSLNLKAGSTRSPLLPVPPAPSGW